ncbi:MAG TPA: helix-turn-helix domain-containing protein [Trebonia sp.]
MLWELSVTGQRYLAVLEVLAGVPVAEVAERYGVSRQSIHTWLVRYRDESQAGPADADTLGRRASTHERRLDDAGFPDQFVPTERSAVIGFDPNPGLSAAFWPEREQVHL